MTNTIPYLETITQWSNSLLGAPAAVLVFILCLAAGWMWKIIHVLPNRFILPVVMVTGALFLPLLMFKEDATWPYYIRSGVVGLIIGCVAWLVLRVFLPKVEKKFGVNLSQEDTIQFSKSDVPPESPPGSPPTTPGT